MSDSENKRDGWSTQLAAERFIDLEFQNATDREVWFSLCTVCRHFAKCSDTKLVKYYLVLLAVDIATYAGLTKCEVIESIAIDNTGELDGSGEWDLRAGFKVLGELLAIGMSATDLKVKTLNLLHAAGLAVVLAGLGRDFYA